MLMLSEPGISSRANQYNFKCLLFIKPGWHSTKTFHFPLKNLLTFLFLFLCWFELIFFRSRFSRSFRNISNYYFPCFLLDLSRDTTTERNRVRERFFKILIYFSLINLNFFLSFSLENWKKSFKIREIKSAWKNN